MAYLYIIYLVIIWINLPPLYHIRQKRNKCFSESSLIVDTKSVKMFRDRFGQPMLNDDIRSIFQGLALMKMKKRRFNQMLVVRRVHKNMMEFLPGCI